MSDAANHKDGMDGVCEHFMRHVHKEYRGHKSEISSREFVKFAQKFSRTYGIRENDLLQALILRQWFEPSAADTYLIRYDLVRR